MSKKNRRQRRVVTAILCVLVCMLTMQSALAYERIDTGKSVSLTLDYEDFSNVEFKIYKVANVSDAVRFTLTPAFAGYAIDLGSIETTSQWQTLSETVAGYVTNDSIEATRTGTTAADGTITFTDLSVGIYLVMGAQHRAGDSVYTPTPFMICLPNLNEATDRWVYDVTSAVKYERTQDPVEELINITVVKIWDDATYTGVRPTQVSIQLLRNGRVYDTVTLSGTGNRWSYTWRGLSAQDSWQVAEVGRMVGYRVSVRQDGNTFYVTNTFDAREVTEDDEIPLGFPTLPQTGQLWWPVPILAMAGLLLFTMGWVQMKKKEYEHA
ncbi:Cna B-type domain-containing protein [Christensenellaceae bacterium OttesenSCG-928-L17]|nr:Cna B-type domain-containing protein [Christensenellaceae bacterium OttesenSCG-928-L17]